MHRRDYVLIAKVIKGLSPDEVCNSCIEKITNAFCSSLKEESSSFNEQKFRDYIQKGDER